MDIPDGDIVGNKCRKIRPFVGGTIPLEVFVFFFSIGKEEAIKQTRVYTFIPFLLLTVGVTF